MIFWSKSHVPSVNETVWGFENADNRFFGYRTDRID